MEDEYRIKQINRTIDSSNRLIQILEENKTYQIYEEVKYMLIVDAADDSDRTERFTTALNKLKKKSHKCKKILNKINNYTIIENLISRISVYDELIDILSTFYEQLQCPQA